MSWVEIAGFITGAVCVWLVVRRNIWNFAVGMANNVFFLVLFLQAGLYADAWLQVLYFVRVPSVGTGGCTAVRIALPSWSGVRPSGAGVGSCSSSGWRRGPSTRC